MTDMSRPKSGHLSVLSARAHPGRWMRAGVNRLDRLRQHRLWQVQVPGPQTPGLISTTTIVAGVLLTLTPFLWAGSANSSGWTAAGWNAAVTGIAITSLGLVRLTQPIRLAVATGLGCLFGAWLLLAPLFLNYGVNSQSVLATNADVVGIAVLLITILGHFHARTCAETSMSSPRQSGRR